jgi:hypothetical protein
VVHSFDESQQGRATRAEALAALRTRMASELPAAKLLGSAESSAPVVVTPTADLESTTQWLVRQEVRRGRRSSGDMPQWLTRERHQISQMKLISSSISFALMVPHPPSGEFPTCECRRCTAWSPR